MSDFVQLARDETGKLQALEYARQSCYLHCGELTLFKVNNAFVIAYNEHERPTSYDNFDEAWQRLTSQLGILWVEDPQRDKRRIAELEREVATLRAERFRLQRVRDMLSHHRLALTFNNQPEATMDEQPIPVGWCVFYHDVCQGQHYLELLACDDDLSDAVDLAAVSGLRTGLLQHVFVD
jgi:hypothetical protein